MHKEANRRKNRRFNLGLFYSISQHYKNPIFFFLSSLFLFLRASSSSLLQWLCFFFFFSELLCFFMNSNTKSILGFSNSDETHRDSKSNFNSNAINPFDSLLIKPPPTSEFMTETQINAPPQQIQETNSFEELKLQHLRILPKPVGGGIGIGSVMVELENVDDHNEDEGCRTPTSIQHKIPLIQQCPYAPKKPKSIPCRKRRSTTSSNSIRFVRRRIDFYDCLSPLVQTHLEDLGCRIKKIRATPPTSPYKI